MFRSRRHLTLVAAVAIVATVLGGIQHDQARTADAAGSVDPSGASAPIGNLDGWSQIFVDNFGIDVPLGQFPGRVSDKWDAYPYPWKDTSKKGTYHPGKVVSIDNGILTKDLRTENDERLVAALTPKVTGSSPYGQLYGRYSMRFRIDQKIPGYKIASLLWPDTGTHITGSSFGVGGNGEIDFPETELHYDKVLGFVHHQNATRGDDQDYFIKELDLREWHTYTFEWSPDLVVAYVDGVEIGRTSERIPRTPMHWVIQTETSPRFETLSSTRGKIMLDWVAVWSYDPSATDGPVPTSPPTTNASGLVRAVRLSNG